MVYLSHFEIHGITQSYELFHGRQSPIQLLHDDK